MEPALAALCRGGGWSYAAVWRFHPHDPRLLTLGESYCEDEAITVLEKMRTQVHIVGIIGEAIVSGNYEWIFSDTWHALNQTNAADNHGLFQGHTWWQHQFLNGIKTIAILPLQLLGMVQFGSFRKVPRNLDFINQVRYIFEQMKGTSRDHPVVYSQINSPTYGQQTILNSLGSENVILVKNKANPLQNEKLEGSIERTESLRSSLYSPINSQGSLNDLTSQGTGNITMRTQMPAPPANESICEIRELDNVTESLHHQQVDVTTPLQVSSCRKAYSNIASLMSAYKNLNSLHGTEKESSGQNMPEHPPYQYSTTNTPSSGPGELCYSSAGFSSSFTTVHGEAKKSLQNDSENLLHSSISFSNDPCVSKIQENSLSQLPVLVHDHLLVPDPRECLSRFSPEESFIVHNDLMQLKDATQTTCQGSSTFPELPNRTPEEATAGTSVNDMEEQDANKGLLESMMLDLSSNSFVQDWWDDSVPQARNLRNLADTHPESVTDKHSSSTGERVLPAISVIEQLLGGGAHKPAGHIPHVMKASDLTSGVSEQLPQFAFRDSVTAYTTQVPSLACGNYTSRNAQIGSSKATSVPPADIPLDDSCSLNTANSKGSQANNPEGTKVAKKRARAGESTRPRPKDRQLIQDRVKELREMVPNGAKCSIDALLDRTIKHMLFLQSVTKYAEKIKQADEPEMIDKESGVILKDNNPNSGKNGGATWAYEVAGQTMACPIVIEDLSPPGQMLVEMLCEERGFFLEIADNIRGFGLTILKGLMEARDGKIWARFLVEANRGVTRMDVFLSLVRLLEQNSLVASTDQATKVMNNGVPSFAGHQRSSLPVPVGVAGRLQ